MNLDVLSEFLGTLVLILFGNGVVASVNLKRMFANQNGGKWILIVFAWGFGVLFGILTSKSLNGNAHLNPAVSTMFVVSGNINVQTYFMYFFAQIAGAIVAQIVVDFINWKHFKESELSMVRSCHCTKPAFSNFKKDKAVVFNFAYEFVGTMLLLGLIIVIGVLTKAKIFGTQNNFFSNGMGVTWLVVVIGMSFGVSTGYAINPARDLGPRIVYVFTGMFLNKSYAKLKKFAIDWENVDLSYAWLPVCAPVFAGVVAGGFNMIAEISPVIS